MDNPKPIQPGELVVGSIGQGRYGGRQIVGKYDGRNKKGEHTVIDRKGAQIAVVKIRRAHYIPPAVKAEIEKLRQNPHLTRRQVNKILDLTNADIMGLRVGRRGDTRNVFFVYRGRRYDIDSRGQVTREEKLGFRNPSNARNSKSLRCPLCGTENHIGDFQLKEKCKECGFPLRRVRIKIK